MNRVVKIIDRGVTVSLTATSFSRGVEPDRKMKEKEFKALLTDGGRDTYGKVISVLEENR